MPFYAVALGHTPGVYDSWGECCTQITGFKGAKFKKFATVKEAEAFIAQVGSGCKTGGNTNERTAKVAKRARQDADETDWPGHFTHFMAENLSPPNLMRVDQVSPSDTQLYNISARLTAMESKLNNYIDKTTKTFEKLTSRIVSLEKLVASKTGAVPPAVADVTMDTVENPSVANVGISSFHWKDDKTVSVYTDGACSSNGRSEAKAGIGVWFSHNHPLNVSAPVKGAPTNNTAEIQAARIAITQAASAGIKNLAIHTDSKFVIDCITKWIHRWKKNGWKLSTGGPVKNKVELLKLDEAIQSLDSVQWIHVRGHCGNLGNEMADRLARDGAEKYDSTIRYADHVDGEDDDNEMESETDD
ncbi:RnaseH [Nesidiocoris tenuis]|uniref:Ribonuclease H1 n=1 Tax=Nesidiocoris tenuis TaxID=355587 RepID=A0ABN7AT52_9HEMI|nr:RnaseH [Nesidiocoris tenuis]